MTTRGERAQATDLAKARARSSHPWSMAERVDSRMRSVCGVLGFAGGGGKSHVSVSAFRTSRTWSDWEAALCDNLDFLSASSYGRTSEKGANVW